MNIDEINANFDRRLIAHIEKAKTPAQCDDVAVRVENARAAGNLRPVVEQAFLARVDALMAICKAAEQSPRRLTKQAKPAHKGKPERRKKKKKPATDKVKAFAPAAPAPNPERVRIASSHTVEPFHSPFAALAALTAASASAGA